MSVRPPWGDALRRAAGGPPPASAAPTTAPRAGASAATVPFDPARVSPQLAALMAEREQLQAGMRAVTGGDGADPRYTVQPMAARRAEHSRWSEQRDSVRGAATVSQENTERVRASVWPKSPAPALRATRGETEPTGRVPTDPSAWMTARDASSGIVERVRVAAPDDDWARPKPLPKTRPDTRATPLPASRAAEQPTPLPDGATTRTATTTAGDPLERRLVRARDLVSRARKNGAKAEQALSRARSAIPDAWLERARERIPGLGRADPYVRETARKLSVAVGTIDELSAKGDQLRASARAVRELKEADESNDDARRDRALERLKGRRAESA